MEYVQGITLAEHGLRGMLPSPLQGNRTLMGMQMAEALAQSACSRHRAPRRQTEPISCCRIIRPRAKIGDFGLAHLVDESPLTRSGMVAGTPQFMSPEQALGERWSTTVAICLAWVVSCTPCVPGKSPFPAKSILEAVRRVCDQSPQPLQRFEPISTSLAMPIDRSDCWPRIRADRFQSARRGCPGAPAASCRCCTLESIGAAAGSSGAMPLVLLVLPLGLWNQLRSNPLTCMSLKSSGQHLFLQQPGSRHSTLDRRTSIQEYQCRRRQRIFQRRAGGRAAWHTLAKLKGLHVAASLLGISVQGPELWMFGNVGRQLNVDAILEGSVRKAGDQLRIAVQLSDAKTGYQLWAERYDRQN